MNASDIIAVIALLMSVASFAYGVRTARQNRGTQIIEKRIKLLTSVTKFILMQERIVVAASQLSQTSSSNKESWKQLAINKEDMAKRMRITYDDLENLNSTDMDFYHRYEASINNMLETAKCDLEWLQKAQSDIHRAQDRSTETPQD